MIIMIIWLKMKMMIMTMMMLSKSVSDQGHRLTTLLISPNIRPLGQDSEPQVIFFAVYSFPDVRCTANNRYILSQKWHSCDSYVTVARKGNQGVGLDVVQNGEDMMMTVSSWLYVDIMMNISWIYDEYMINVYCWYNDGQTSGTRKRLKGLGHNTNNQVIRITDNYG